MSVELPLCVVVPLSKNAVLCFLELSMGLFVLLLLLTDLKIVFSVIDPVVSNMFDVVFKKCADSLCCFSLMFLP